MQEEVNTNTTTMHRFETAEPKIFRIGDIVEAQVSFVATPLQNGKRKLRTVMRTVALLDGSFAQVRHLFCI